jgi:hypothetical protein
MGSVQQGMGMSLRLRSPAEPLYSRAGACGGQKLLGGGSGWVLK